MSDPLRAAGSNLPADYAPTPALSREIDAIARETRERAAAVAAEADLWQSLAAEIGEPPSGGVSLRVALDRRRRERDARVAQVRAESAAAARREDEHQNTRAAIETNRTIAAAEREAAKLVGAQLAESIITEAKKKAADVAAANKVAADRAKQEALERVFAADRAAVARHLTAFTADGNKYEGANAGAAKGPASLTAVQGLGALDDSEYGLRQMLFALHPGNNRRSGLDWVVLVMHLPPENWSEAQQTHVRESQRLLRKYGELMVEKGLLAP